MRNKMLRRLIASTVALIAGLALLVSPASAATLSLTVYRPAVTAAGSTVTLKAKATPGAYCAIGITGVLSYGYRKYASSTGAVSWTPRVPSAATAGDHSVKVSCVKGGRRVTRYTTLVVTHTVTWQGNGDAQFSTRSLRIPNRTFTVTVEFESCCYAGMGGIEAEWTNSTQSRSDHFTVYDNSETSGGKKEATFVSDQGATSGWLNVHTWDNDWGNEWKLTVTGVAN
jgi:hypothetical protein